MYIRIHLNSFDTLLVHMFSLSQLSYGADIKLNTWGWVACERKYTLLTFFYTKEKIKVSQEGSVHAVGTRSQP